MHPSLRPMAAARLIQAKARRRTVASSRPAFRGWLESVEPKIIRALLMLWNKQRGLVTTSSLNAGTSYAYLPENWTAAIRKSNEDLVKKTLSEAWRDGFIRAGNQVEAGVRSNVRRKAFEDEGWVWEGLTELLARWIKERGANLVAEITKEQLAALRDALQLWLIDQPQGRPKAAKLIREIVGLTGREERAVARFWQELVDQGAGGIEAKVASYADRLRKTRALRIARTELSDAWHVAQQEAAEQAADAGAIPGTLVRRWLAAEDEVTCPQCGALDEEVAGLNESFSDGTFAPPAHPGCRCDISYEIEV